MRGGDVEHRARRPAESVTGELGVGNDADDTECAGKLSEVETEVLVDGIFIALEEAFDEGLIYDGDRRGGFVVGCGEMPPLQHGNAEMLQIVGTDAIPRGARLFVDFRRWMPRDHDQLTPIVGKRVVHGDVSAFDTGDAAQIILEPAAKSDLGRQRFFTARTEYLELDAICDLEAEILMLEFVEAAAEHRCASDEHDGERCLCDEKSFAREG